MPCEQDPCLERGTTPAPTGAHHDRSANALRQPAARGSAPARTTGAYPTRGHPGGPPAPAQPPPRQPSPGPGSRYLPQHGGTGLWPARGGGVSGAQGGRRQLCRPGGGAPRAAPAPVSGWPLPSRPGDGPGWRLSRRARGGHHLCFQPAGSPSLPPGTLGSADAATVAPARQRLDELRGSPGAWGTSRRHQQLSGAVTRRGVRAGSDPDPHQLPAGDPAGDPVAHRCR